MARTDSNLVEGVLRAGSAGGDYDDVNSPSLTPYIDTASAIVDRVVACATKKGISLSDSEEELIERWLAAHCYCMSDQTYMEKHTQRSVGIFHGRTGMNLDATKYGQTAQTVDPSGCLAAIGNRQIVKMTWLGKRPSEQVDYRDRR